MAETYTMLLADIVNFLSLGAKIDKIAQVLQNCEGGCSLHACILASTAFLGECN